MEQAVSIIRSALHLQVAALIVKGRIEEIPRLAEQNPMSWLAERPKNYAGEYYAPRPEDVVSGTWCFDLKNRNLIYFARSNTYLRITEGEQNQIRFQVKLITNTEDIDQGNRSAIQGVSLEQVSPYTWF
jgi:hypothetical protein